MSELAIEVTRENAQNVLIEESFRRPVLVDFWADWCAPCKALLPILEKLVAENAGNLLLAKVNCDQQQMIAGQFGVRSLPTVILMKDGQPVDGFVGAQPEAAVRAMLEKHLPKPWDTAIAEAIRLLEANDLAGALPLARGAWEQSGKRSDIAKVLTEILIELGRLEEARAVLAAFALVDRDADYERLLAALELKEQAADTPEIQGLIAALARDPDNRDLQFQLAVQYNQAARAREALELLFDIVKADREFRGGEARKTLLDIIRALGKGDPLAAEYQRKLFSLMY
jgi:putative thioredoxin